MPAALQHRSMVVAIALIAAGFAGCSNGRAQSTATNGSTATAPSASGADAEPAGAPTTASTAKHAPTSATAKPAPPGLGPGAKGPEVQELETKLDAMKYSVGKVDGVYDGLTAEGVIAFQKVSGMARTGRATDDVRAAVTAARTPEAMLPGGGATRVEVDLKRQVLFLYENGSLSRTLMISSGGGYRYCVKGRCDKAITPGGSFRIGTKILGKHVAPLGVLYNPLFFNGGIAIHGEPAVPVTPASHGCVRIPMSSSRWFYDRVQKGTPVYVLGGPKAPVPFDTPGPDGEAPVSPQTPPTPAAETTTTVPVPVTVPGTTTTAKPATTSTTAAPSTTTTTSAPTTTTTTAPATTTTAGS